MIFNEIKVQLLTYLTFKIFLSDALYRGSNVDVIYTNFAKIISFIENRQQIVVYKEFLSIPVRVTSGVPQGSHLAPILFLIFINDILFQTCSELMFADDIKIFRTVNNQNEADLLQLDLNYLYEWCTYNNFTLNINKCQLMTFSRARVVSFFDYNLNGEPLLRTFGPIKDFGIYFDPKPKFDCHITNIVNRSNKILGFIYRNCADFDDSLALKSVYCSLVRSICEYGSIIWSPYQSGHKHKIEEIQHKFLRFLSHKCSIIREPHSSYTSLLTFLNIETLEQRHLRLELYFTYKLLTGLIDCPEFLCRFSFHTPSRNS
ncbi:uncharacterized protein LOC112690015 [Sipha flava]|uniref:Uncharacterized protein LOC112690015 n=1 Tax=Sipha flava TaxID=143950 RepID=A0A8B8GAQ1_9HEMI|nr:uncharacterized protein LOC112690015 [Sipha flava]